MLSEYFEVQGSELGDESGIDFPLLLSAIRLPLPGLLFIYALIRGSGQLVTFFLLLFTP